MGRIRATIRIPGLDLENLKAAIKKAIEIQSRLAARAFIRASVPRVPIQSGMARGSFLNLGRALRVAIPMPLPYSGDVAYVEVKRKRKGVRPHLYKAGETYKKYIKWYYHPNGSRYRKTPEMGAKLSSVPAGAKAEDIFTWKDNGTLVFSFQSAVNHFNLNNFDGTPTVASSPWHAIEAGKDAYIAEMANLRQKLPKISEYIVETNITHGALSRYRENKIRIRNRRKF